MQTAGNKRHLRAFRMEGEITSSIALFPRMRTRLVRQGCTLAPSGSLVVERC